MIMITLPRSIVMILMFVAFVRAQSACQIPVGETGICTPSKDCNITVNTLTLPQNAPDYYQCGTENNVQESQRITIMITLPRSIVTILMFVTFGPPQSACETPIGETGICIPAKECSIIADILTNTPKPLPQKALDYLKSSYCGTENNVDYACCAARHRINQTPTQIPIPIPTPAPTPTSPDGEMEVNNVEDHPNLSLLPLGQCGRIKPIRDSYGDKISIGEFPWNAKLKFDAPTDEQYRGGGALISSRYVLTGAHCVTGKMYKLVSVRLGGEDDQSSENDCKEFGNKTDCIDKPQDIDIEEIIFHPGFIRDNLTNDVALLRLSREVNINTDTVQAVCLPVTEESQLQKLDKSVISGWDLTDKIMLKATVPVLPNERCQSEFESVQFTNAHFCAGAGNKIGSCRISATHCGPLIHPIKDPFERYVQYGLLSEVNDCDSPSNFPAVYTKVSSYMKWILDQLKP